jgi:hypothetical protein
MIGRITSYTSNGKLSQNGWAVMYNYDCTCGNTHSTVANGVWHTGDILEQPVRAKCPDTDTTTEVILIKPKESR